MKKRLITLAFALIACLICSEPPHHHRKDSFKEVDDRVLPGGMALHGMIQATLSTHPS